MINGSYKTVNIIYNNISIQHEIIIANITESLIIGRDLIIMLGINVSEWVHTKKFEDRVENNIAITKNNLAKIPNLTIQLKNDNNCYIKQYKLPQVQEKFIDKTN